jgi:hypothetical protein
MYGSLLMIDVCNLFILYQFSHTVTVLFYSKSKANRLGRTGHHLTRFILYGPEQLREITKKGGILSQIIATSKVGIGNFFKKPISASGYACHHLFLTEKINGFFPMCSSLTHLNLEAMTPFRIFFQKSR